MSGEQTPSEPLDSAAAEAPSESIETGHGDARASAPAAPEHGELGGSPTGESASEDGAEGQGREGLRQLEAELATLRADNESLRSQYMRIAADFDNFRKRQSRDQEDLKLQITCSTLGEILPVVDNFDRARQQLNPQGEEAQNLHRSYQGLYKQLVDVFKQLGVSPMRVEGEPFDPSLHEAVLREPSDDHLEDVVIAELQRGYHLEGRVLRHALVKVSMGPGPNRGEDPAATPEPDPTA